jgi:hypothetical protein
MPTTSEVSTRLSADNSNFRTVFRQSEDVAEKTGKAILKKIDLRAGVGAIAAAVGFNMQAIAEGVARFITGMSKDEEKRLEDLVDKTGKAADEAERRLAKARERAEKEREAAGERTLAQMKLVSDARQEAIKNEIESEKRLRQSAYDRQKKADEDHVDQIKENLELLTLEAKAKQGLTMEEANRLKILREQTKETARQQEITTLLSLNKRTPEEEVLLQTLLKQAAAYKSQLGTVTAITEETKKQGEEIVSNIAAWDKFKVSVTSSGRGDRELSDRELQRKVANIQQALFVSEINRVGRVGVGNERGEDPFSFINQANLAGARNELNLRRDVRRRASAFGEDAAFQQFPGLTEQRFSEIIKGIDTSSAGKLANAIEKLNQRLDAPLQATLKPTPFG